MTPEEYLGHAAFRTVESKAWPPKDRPCWAAFLQHADGTLVFYLRGVATAINGKQIADIVAKDVFGDGCHRCVKAFTAGLLMPDGQYKMWFSTTERKGRENPWGELCESCRVKLAAEAKEQYHSRLKSLGFHPDADILHE